MAKVYKAKVYMAVFHKKYPPKMKSKYIHYISMQ